MYVVKSTRTQYYIGFHITLVMNQIFLYYWIKDKNLINKTVDCFI